VLVGPADETELRSAAAQRPGPNLEHEQVGRVDLHDLGVIRDGERTGEADPVVEPAADGRPVAVHGADLLAPRQPVRVRVRGQEHFEHVFDRRQHVSGDGGHRTLLG